MIQIESNEFRLCGIWFFNNGYKVSFDNQLKLNRLDLRNAELLKNDIKVGHLFTESLWIENLVDQMGIKSIYEIEWKNKTGTGFFDFRSSILGNFRVASKTIKTPSPILMEACH